jgi:hypothetical protein
MQGDEHDGTHQETEQDKRNARIRNRDQGRTELKLAMLVAEDEDGQYEPVAVAASINEAKEIAGSDLRGRTRGIERGEDARLCPVRYELWARGVDGEYLVAAVIEKQIWN